MRKTVLTFGVISGLISAVTMLATVPFLHKLSGDKGLILGYTTIVLAGLLVFFGIRSYRDNVSDGQLTFARALAVGILISVLSNCFYVATWEVVSYKFMPDFAEKYASQMVEHAKSSGASQQKIDETARQAADFVRNYHHPLYNISMTFLEPFPVFLVITLISAAVLRKKTATSPA
ncbi:MAG: DUF4199 domain-containing protein [Candidatus Sulfotelmatobacter sp.]